MFDKIFWLNLTIQLRNRISLIRWLHENADMKMLAEPDSARELKQAQHYAIYEPELSRAWPDEEGVVKPTSRYSLDSTAGASAISRMTIQANLRQRYVSVKAAFTGRLVSVGLRIAFC